MLNVTQKAADVLARTLGAGGALTSQGFRIVPGGPGTIVLALDEERDGDQVIRHRDQNVILADRQVAQALDGAVLDISEHPDGTSLTLYGSGRNVGY